jgi:glutamate carboxypeptidase
VVALADGAEVAVKWLEGKESEMLASIARLVEVNSYTENREGGLAVGALLKQDTFACDALSCEAVVASARYADHLVFRSTGARGRRPIALIGHLDTVFPPGTFEGFRRDGDRARGPGVLDMKGGLVVIAYALRAIAAAYTGGLDAIAPLCLCIVADEEVGSPEGRPLIEGVTRGAAAALVFESGRAADVIITRRKGTGSITAVAHGKAAHAGAAHRDGRNAIWALAVFVDLAQRLTDYDRGLTVNVGKVSGGYGKNTVPDRAEGLVDIRFCTRDDGERLVGSLREAAELAQSAVPGTRIELDGGIARLPLERTEKSLALYSAYAACARTSGLGGGEAPLIGGGSDASTTSAIGIPSIDGLGPRGSGFHTKDEHIEISSLVPKAQALVRFLINEAETAPPGDPPAS